MSVIIENSWIKLLRETGISVAFDVVIILLYKIKCIAAINYTQIIVIL